MDFPTTKAIEFHKRNNDGNENTMQIKRIKCPKCNVILDVKNEKELPVLRLHCPNCKTLLQVKFSPKEEPVEAPTYYARPKQPVDNGETQLGNGYSARSEQANAFSCETQLGDGDSNNKSASQRTATLVFEGKGFPLEEGRNIIGRQATTSQATIQIPTRDHFMSRQHCVINITTLSDGRKKAVISNFQNKNDTSINGHKIGSGDAIILQDGNTITMGETTVTYNVTLNM